MDEYTLVDFDGEFNSFFLNMLPKNDNDISNKHIIQGHYDGDWG